MPLTTLEKRWMKTLLQDRRIALFSPEMAGLEDVEPLFNMDDVVYFDQYLDGDPYEDAAYIAVFHQLMTAIREHRRVRLCYSGHKGARHAHVCVPYRMEYSEKDDKFRVLTVAGRTTYTINVARIQRCELLDTADRAAFQEPRPRQKSLTFLLHDERNALDRVLLHFSHFEKETVRLDDRDYQVTLRYEKDDETELLIRVLSFGPMIQVTAPDNFIQLVRERLQRQASCGLKN
jgi:predicted DNA-binding transcriptional regulator YafY